MGKIQKTEGDLEKWPHASGAILPGLKVEGDDPMKRPMVLVMALALIALASGMAPAETYVEGYLGSNFTVTSPNPLEFNVNPAYRGPTTANLEFPRHLSAEFLAGIKIGTWFVKEGFPGFDYPDWMKYFGFYVDVSYHRMHIKDDVGSRRLSFYPSLSPHYQPYMFYGKGDITTVAFMVAFRYGFNKTEKVPFGRIQPYVAVGPAIFINGFSPTLRFQPGSGEPRVELIPANFPTTPTGSFKSSVSVALAAETGVRWMITRFLSLDTSVKYRYARPSSTYDIFVNGFTHELRFAPQFNLFSIQTGVAYHF